MMISFQSYTLNFLWIGVPVFVVAVVCLDLHVSLVISSGSVLFGILKLKNFQLEPFKKFGTRTEPQKGTPIFESNGSICQPNGVTKRLMEISVIITISLERTKKTKGFLAINPKPKSNLG